MIPPNRECSSCGCKPSEVSLSMETAQLNVKLAKEISELKKKLEANTDDLLKAAHTEIEKLEVNLKAAVEAADHYRNKLVRLRQRLRNMADCLDV